MNLIKYKWVKGYEGRYKISMDGELFSFVNKIPVKLKASEDSYGYPMASLGTGRANERKRYKVHRLVAMAFLPNPNNYPQVNHIDGVKNNNKIDNLEWCTCSHNVRHADATGLIKRVNGENRPTAKLNTEAVLLIRKMYETGEYTQTNLALQFGISKSQISNIVYRRKWKHLP